MNSGRYSRNMPALSPEECAVLRQKHVCVVGCGGLGGYIIEILARIGIGALTVVDGDVFDVTNLNRQLLSDETLLGAKKAEIAAARVSRINSDVKITAVSELFTAQNGLRILEGCDLVVDALDNIDSRQVLADVCAKRNLFLVHGAISGWFGQVTVVAPGSKVLDKLYPPRAKDAPKKGNPSFTPAVCASIQAAEAIKLLCGRQTSLLGKLLFIDLRTMEFIKINI
ncbi:MAG: HesA/MoeB/ThiF family protein [Peptococcaceae bacterium]|nr:HesA/MoeB/ThiF family protein [Peptococcaceae bacterium]